MKSENEIRERIKELSTSTVPLDYTRLEILTWVLDSSTPAESEALCVCGHIKHIGTCNTEMIDEHGEPYECTCVGTPAVKAETSKVKECTCRSPIDAWCCTLPEGHHGNHIATVRNGRGGSDVLEEWKNKTVDPEQPEKSCGKCERFISAEGSENLCISALSFPHCYKPQSKAVNEAPDINKADGWVTNSGFKKQMHEWKCAHNELHKRLATLESKDTLPLLRAIVKDIQFALKFDTTDSHGELAKLERAEK